MVVAWVMLGIAIVFLTAELFVSGGVLGFFGICALVASGFLFRDAGVEIPIAAIIIGALLLGGFVIFAARKVIQAHREEPVRTGWEELIGATGEVREPLGPSGQVFIEGALWRARLAEGEEPIAFGERVQVQSVDGLVLVVHRAG